MVNVTISVTEELKSEMDKFSDINWSEVCRRAIAKEMQYRKSQVPQIGIILKEAIPESPIRSPVRPDPGLVIALSIYNKMPFEIVLDRILCKVRFRVGSRVIPVSDTFYLNKIRILSNSNVDIRFPAYITERRINEIDHLLTTTFYCELLLTVFAEDFRVPHYESDLTTRIPIDEWKKMVLALESGFGKAKAGN